MFLACFYNKKDQNKSGDLFEVFCWGFFFVVGENRGLSFLLNNIKFVIWSLILIIGGLSGAIAFQYHTSIQDQERFKLQIDQETIIDVQHHL